MLVAEVNRPWAKAGRWLLEDEAEGKMKRPKGLRSIRAES
jgi:hypothetical protein